MATVEVSNFGQLVAAIKGTYTEDSTILLTADIDLNDDPNYRTGITETCSKATGYDLVVSGGTEGHTIKNIYCNDSAVRVFDGNSRYSDDLIFDNIDFENALIESGRLFNKLTIKNASVSANLVAASSSPVYMFAEDTLFDTCGVKLTGSGNIDIRLYTINSFKFCNIDLNGEFRSVNISLNNSYISGNFHQISSSNTFTITSSYCSIFNATATFDKMPAGGSNILLLYNTDKVTLPSTGTIPSDWIGVTDTEMKTVNDLQGLGFPIR